MKQRSAGSIAALIARARGARLSTRARAAVVLSLSAAALIGVLQLEVDAGPLGLLRADAPQVAAADQVRESTGADQLVVALSGLEPEALEAAATELAERAGRRDDIAHAHARFDTEWFEQRVLWCMGEPQLEALATRVEELAALQRERRSGSSLGLDDARELELAEAIESIEQDARERVAPLRFTSEDGRYRFVVLVPTVQVTDVERTAPLLRGLEHIARELEARHPGLESRFTGKLALVQEQQQVLQRDLAVTSVAALLLCVVVMAVFLRSVRAPLVIGGAIALGAFWTLGVAGLFAGPLNVISALLFPVLAGLGVDFGIHVAIDYRRERLRRSGPPVGRREAMRRAVRATRAPAAIAALTTAAAFAALTFAELRGLTQLGWLAPVGILCALVATYLVAAPLLWRVDGAEAPRPSPATAKHIRSPRLTGGASWVVVAAATALAAVAATHLGALRFENDYRLLRPDSDDDAFFEYVDAQLDVRFDPTVVLVSMEDLARTRAIVEARRDAPGARTEHVVGLDDFLPNTSARHRRGISRLRAALGDPIFERAADERVERARALAAQAPWTAAELPAAVRDRFVTRDGERAVLLVYGDERIQSDRAALRWIAELEVLRDALSADSIDAVLSNEALLPVWVFSSITADGPRLLGVAAASVALFVLLHFVCMHGRRGLRVGAAILVSLGGAMLVGLGALALLGVPLTTFNLAVVPCVVGIGVDDLVHLGHRASRQSLRSAVVTTAPAIVLTSLTTLIGFGATMLAHHPGLRTVAPVALILVACTTVAALVIFPALLQLLGVERGR